MSTNFPIVGYRRTGVSSGPGSSTGSYDPKLDPGKNLPAPPIMQRQGSQGSIYRRIGVAAGPSSSMADTNVAPHDSESSLGVSGKRDPGAFMSVSGGSSKTQGAQCPSCNVVSTLGGRFCSNCGASIFIVAVAPSASVSVKPTETTEPTTATSTETVTETTTSTDPAPVTETQPASVPEPEPLNHTEVIETTTETSTENASETASTENVTESTTETVVDTTETPTVEESVIVTEDGTNTESQPSTEQ
jgi:hypothetical protein